MREAFIRIYLVFLCRKMAQGLKEKSMRTKKIIALMLTLALMITCFAGCGKNKEVNQFANREERIVNNELIVAIGSEPETGL